MRGLSLSVLLLSLLSVVGCSTSDAEDDGRPVVLTTFTVLADMTRAVGGEHVVVESVTKPGIEIHGYEPTPSDLRRAAQADLILDNGLGLEAWFEQFVADLDAPHVVVSSGVDPIPISGSDAANPHAWMSPTEALGYVDVIEKALTDLVPDRAAAFAANAAAYRAEIEAVRDGLVADLEALPAAQRALVTCEGAFSYLARDAGLTEQFLWAVNSEQQATPQQIASVVEYVRANEVPAVFCESTVSDAAMQQVVSATGAAFGGVLYVDSLSEADGPVPTYLDLLRHDAATIAGALTGESSA